MVELSRSTFVAVMVFALSVRSLSGVGGASAQETGSSPSETEVVWWTTMAQDQSQKVVQSFMAKYPTIKASYWRSGSNGLHNKIMTEARVDRHSWDVVTYTAEFVLELKKKSLIAAYDSPARKYYSDDMKDKEGYWTALYALPTGLGYNTKLVKKEDVPRTYEALLQTKKKGLRISIDNEGESLLSGLIQAWGKDKATHYMKQLATQDVVPGRGNTQRAQAVAAGEYPLLIAYTHSIEWFKLQGAPVDWVNLEPAVVQVNPVMLAANAAHPKAGKLFIDFLLSKDGQKLLQSFHRVTTRGDVKPNPPRLIEGFKRVVLYPEEHETLAASAKLYKEIFGLR
jgi:ABC-type Fe3+ transport system substrate-binding protein